MAIFTLKATFFPSNQRLLKTLLKSWFHEIFWAWSNFIALFHTTVHKIAIFFFVKSSFLASLSWTSNSFTFSNLQERIKFLVILHSLTFHIFFFIFTPFWRRLNTFPRLFCWISFQFFLWSSKSSFDLFRSSDKKAKLSHM